MRRRSTSARNAPTVSWEAARRLLEGLPGGQGLNIAHEAVDCHACSAHPGRAAFRLVGRDGALLEAGWASFPPEGRKKATRTPSYLRMRAALRMSYRGQRIASLFFFSGHHQSDFRRLSLESSGFYSQTV